MKPKSFVSTRVFAATRQEKLLEITMYGTIGEDYWTGEGITPKSVKKEMDAAGDFTRVSVRINSPGGNAFDGVAIYNVLRASRKPVDVYVDGIAASAASIIAMAGDTVTMGHGSMLMIHDPWSLVAGNAADMREYAGTLDKIADSMTEIYSARTGKSGEDVRTLMKAETWMSAQEAVDSGFATDIAEGGSAEALAAAKDFPLLSKLRNVPQELKATTPEAPAEKEPEAVAAPPAEPPTEAETATNADSSKAAPTGPPAEHFTVLRERFELERLIA